jgi:hypothetical protein
VVALGGGVAWRVVKRERRWLQRLLGNRKVGQLNYIHLSRFFFSLKKEPFVLAKSFP